LLALNRVCSGSKGFGIWLLEFWNFSLPIEIPCAMHKATIPNLGMGFPLEMLSAVIPWEHSYPAMLLTKQQAHQRFPQPGPLVLWSASLKNRTVTADMVRTVSRVIFQFYNWHRLCLHPNLSSGADVLAYL